MIPLLTVFAAAMMMSSYRIANSPVAIWCVIAVIAPFASFPAFMSLMWAGACVWKRALSIAEAISWAVILERGTVLYVLCIGRLSALLKPGIGAGAGQASFF